MTDDRDMLTLRAGRTLLATASLVAAGALTLSVAPATAVTSLSGSTTSSATAHGLAGSDLRAPGGSMPG